jgi:hypothetical protein
MGRPIARMKGRRKTMAEQKEQKKEPASEQNPKTVYHQEYGARKIQLESEYQQALREGWTDDDPHAKDKERLLQQQDQHQQR